MQGTVPWREILWGRAEGDGESCCGEAGQDAMGQFSKSG
jgi:hypothetical protein